MNNIAKAKKGFETSFFEAEFYNRQTQDDEHLNSILKLLTVQDDDKILDLGTGSGYLAFTIAKRHSKTAVVGLDIVSKTLEQNKVLASEQGISNLEFIDYDGMTFPYSNNTFDWIVTRYALHHFPKIQYTFNEIARVLKPNGFLFISDPTPNNADVNRFVDSYMQLKDDGHSKFYTLAEFSGFANNSGIKLKTSFLTLIRFARKMESSYSDLLRKTDDAIKQAYKIEIIGDECYISEDVLNIIFQKS